MLAATQIFAQRTPGTGGDATFPTAADFTRILGEKSADSSPMISRAAIDGLRQSPSVLHILPLLMRWDTPPQDALLIYGARVALRDCLLHPGVYAEIQTGAFWRGCPARQQLSASPVFTPKIGRGSRRFRSPSPRATRRSFCSRISSALNLHGARSGDYLRHAVLHLPAEKLGAITALVGAIRRRPAPAAARCRRQPCAGFPRTRPAAARGLSATGRSARCSPRSRPRMRPR